MHISNLPASVVSDCPDFRVCRRSGGRENQNGKYEKGYFLFLNSLTSTKSVTYSKPCSMSFFASGRVLTGSRVIFVAFNFLVERAFLKQDNKTQSSMFRRNVFVAMSLQIICCKCLKPKSSDSSVLLNNSFSLRKKSTNFIPKPGSTTSGFMVK